MQIVHHPVRSVSQNRPVAMTVEMLHGFGAADEDVRVEITKAKLDWPVILAVAIPLAIIVPILLAGLSGEKPSEKAA